MSERPPAPPSSMLTQLVAGAALGLAITGTLVAAVSRVAVVRGFAAVEQAEAEANLQRALVALDVDLEHLDSMTLEWSVWDDPFELAGGTPNDFVAENVHEATLERLRASEIVLIDRAGAVVAGLGQDHPDGPTRPPTAGWVALAQAEALATGRGFVRMDGAPFAYATRPLQPSVGSAEPTGTLLIARRLDTLSLPVLARTSAQRLALEPPRRGARPREVSIPSDQEIVGEAVIFDKRRAAVGLLQVRDDRPVHQQALLTVRYLWVLLLVTAAVGLLGGVLWIRRRFVRPTTELAAALAHVRRGGAAAEALPVLDQSLELEALSSGLRAAFIRLGQAEAHERQRLLDEQVARARGDFLARMSHELRTPMNGVMGTMELLEQTPLGPDQLRMVDTVRSSARALLMLVNDVLDLSKMDAGRLSLSPAPTRPARLIAGAVELLQPIALQRGLALRADLELPEALRLQLDPHRLRQVLLNLLGNALKYTEVGSVRLRAWIADGLLCIDVEDTGPGVAPEQQAAIFEPFVMGQGRSGEQASASTGLGLAICRQLVGLMDGELRLVSRLGEGSTFCLRVPCVPAEAATDPALPRPAWSAEEEGPAVRLGAPVAPVDRITPVVSLAPAPPAASGAPASGAPAYAVEGPSAPVPPSPPAAELRGLRVLLVEDNLVNQMVAVGMLELLGCTVQVAEHGGQALDALAAERFELVLMDCQMPVMDGFEATRRLREREREAGGAGLPGHRTPVLAVTANAMEGDCERCLDAGMDAFLAKPLTVNGLRSAMLGLLRQAAATQG